VKIFMSLTLDKRPGILLKKAARLFEQVANKKLAALGATHAQTVILIRLWEKDGQNQIELTKSAGLNQSTVVRLLDRMERDALIKRIRNTEDRRVFNFYLTAKSKKICKKLAKYSYATNKLAHESLSKEDIVKFIQLINVVIGNLEQFLEDK
jgi:MarR family transcriptional regulator for hemolysin